MSKYPRVIEILKAYDKGNMKAVVNYLGDKDLTIDPSTWIGRMKELSDKKNYMSMEAEIASLLFIFKLEEDDKEIRNNGT